MNREHIHILVELLRHCLIERAERCQVLTNHCPLLRGFVKNALFHNVSDVLGTDKRLLIAVLHFEQRIGYIVEGRVFKQDLLNAADEAELCGLDDLAKLPHKANVLH